MMSVASIGPTGWERRAAFSPAETAELLGISEATVFRLMRSGTLASVLIGGSRRIPTSAIQQALLVDSAATTVA
jgi:excisionase family DNA binding protein